MKVLYAIQATDSGHIGRANEIIPYLETKCELDILVSGPAADMELDHFIKYRRKGAGFAFEKKGGIDLLKTWQNLRSKKFLNEINSFPVEEYDLVINDFEPISAWACKIKNIPCVAMSHQYALLHKESPRPFKADPMAWLLLRYYAPCKTGIGFHFKQYAENIFSPVIRSEIRHAYIRNLGHYTVYLPAYHEEKLVKFFSFFKDIQWHIFSGSCKRSYGIDNCWVRPVNHFEFTGSFIHCEGIICDAGFETPAEALFMEKKLLVIPGKQQYEQKCNAAAMEEYGIPVIKNFKIKHRFLIQDWISKKQQLPVSFPDETEKIIDMVLSGSLPGGNISPNKITTSLPALKELIVLPAAAMN
jgi:uncharacterized protein (TIGR00661 family)